MSGSDLLGIGISGLLAAQKALSTVGHNVANVNTEGYSRQSVDLATRDPQYTGGGFIGRGVEVVNIRRSYDQFLTNEIRDTTASLKEFERFSMLASQVDNLLADPQGSLSPALQGFFNSVQDVSNAPASIPARQAMLASAETLVDRFVFFEQRLTEQYANVNTQLSSLVAEVNSLAASLAETNRALVDANGNNSSQVANDLLDRRDNTLAKLAELVTVKSVPQDDGSVNVFIGSGQVLVNGYESQTLSLVDNKFDSSRSELAITVGPSTVEVSSQIRGGALAGVLDFRNRILDATKSALGRIALGLANDFNAQHRLGMDLNGQLGEDFFSIDGLAAPGIAALASEDNTGGAAVSIQVTDTSALTTSDYRLTYLGSDRFRLQRMSDGTTTSIDASAGYPYTATEVDGFTITIDSEPDIRDSFLVQPVFNAVLNFDLAVSNAAEIAMASPIRTSNADANTGAATINAGTLVDRAAYVSDNYTVYLGAETAAVANGVVGTITDNNNDSTLQYDLTINGVTVYSQTEADAPLADLDALAAAINGASDANVANTGVKAYVDATDNLLYLVNVPPTAMPITVTETLTTSAGTTEAGDTMTGYFGGALTGTAATSTVSYPRTADSYVIVDSADAVVDADAYTDGGTIAFNGMEVVISGTGSLGDNFSVDPNLGGIGDNRNALALMALQDAANLENGSASYGDAYGQLVALVGTRTHQAQINFNAQDTLLDHALAARGQIAGVNLDEEATNMMRFQQLYQATAQVIAAADTLFQSLLGVMRR